MSALSQGAACQDTGQKVHRARNGWWNHVLASARTQMTSRYGGPNYYLSTVIKFECQTAAIEGEKRLTSLENFAPKILDVRKSVKTINDLLRAYHQIRNSVGFAVNRSNRLLFRSAPTWVFGVSLGLDSRSSNVPALSDKRRKGPGEARSTRWLEEDPFRHQFCTSTPSYTTWLSRPRTLALLYQSGDGFPWWR